MKLTDFDFFLPEERIARFPSEKRAGSKLMVVERKTGNITHHVFSDITGLIGKNDFFVFNNTKVVPARLFGRVGKSKIEILIVNRKSVRVAEVFAMPGRKLAVGKRVDFENGIEADVVGTGDRGRRLLEFNTEIDEVLKIGFAPLPPYIKRRRDEAEQFREFDLKRYQTVYSKNPGSIAAPTAGLHFDNNTLKSIADKSEILEVTLNVGVATFQKIESENISDHRMGREDIYIPEKVSEKLFQLKKSNYNLIAVGTTSVRSLETYALLDDKTDTFYSELFISPGFEFKLVDKIITNFHLPKSSLFILVSAFAGLELMKKAYEEAVREKYNFFSYGDAMFII